MNNASFAGKLLSWSIGMGVLAIAIINIFWGNDAGFGIFLALLALVYFPPVTALIKYKFGFNIPLIAKILLAVFIIWASLGVGEFFDKVDLMLADLRN